MIKITDLNVVLTDNTGSEVQGTGEMIVGTSPITKEVRDEELNLQNTPNFVISAIIPNADVDVTENYNVSFDANEKHYSTVMTVMTKTNLRTGVKVNLQSTGAEITEEDIVHEPVYIVLAFDKYNRQIPLNNIPAYQSGRNVVFDGAYLMCAEGISSEFVINPKLMYGDMVSPWITENQDANGESLLMDNLGAFALDWSSFEDNNEQTITFKAVISETGSIDEGEVLTTFEITFVGHPESAPEPVYSVHAFDKNDQEIPLNNIPAYQNGRKAAFDGAYLKCREDNSGEWVINPKLVYGERGNFALTASQDEQGRSFFEENLGGYGLDWSWIGENNEVALTNQKVAISEGGTLFVPDSGEDLTSFDITFVGHAESAPEPVYSVHAFDKNDQEIPLNNIPAYQSGTNVVFDGAYLKCREDNSGEWIIDQNLRFGENESATFTNDSDEEGRCTIMDNVGAYIWDWATFEENNEQTMTNAVAALSQDVNIDGEVLATFEITFVCYPESHTLEFDNDNYDTSYDINTGEKSQSRVNVLYDGTSIHLESSMFSGLNYNKFEPIESGGGIFKAKDALPEISAGQTYVDNVTVTYEGMIAPCTVTLTVTDSASQDYTTKIKCNTSKGQFLVYSTDANDTIQTVQYDNYREVDMYYIDCSWSLETDNPDYQNFSYLQSSEATPFDSGAIRSESLNGTVTGGFGGLNGEGNFVQIVDSLSIQIEYVAPEPTTKIKCTTSKGEFLVYSTDANDTIQTVQYNDYTDIGGAFRIPCSWIVETDNPDYQNLSDLQSNGGDPYNIDYIATTSLNGTVTGQFGGWNENVNYVQMLEALSIQIEYVAPE